MDDMTRRLLVAGLPVLACIAAGCGAGGAPTGSQPTRTRPAASRPATTASAATTTTTAPAAPDEPAPRVAPLRSPAPRRLVTRDIVVGRGAVARRGLWASVDYVIASARGRELGSMWGREGSLAIRVGSSMVLRGWDRGMRGMRVGGRRRIVIPPALGYGAAGHRPDVKPGETLIVVVELLALSRRYPAAGG
jgi:peptidylprolyl isomerase